MIVKLQKPLATNGTPMVRVYNKDRSQDFLAMYTKEVADMYGDKLKFYADIDLKARKMNIKKIVEDQPW